MGRLFFRGFLRYGFCTFSLGCVGLCGSCFFFFVWNKISRQNLFPAKFDVSKRFQGFGFLQRLVLGNLVVDCAVSFAIE